uniref:ER membrane protein complex subunit 4 n=1 Tax=Moniliophthora roreri TaxID=221103 RepID=A0A0W0FMR9_MONRR
MNFFGARGSLDARAHSEFSAIPLHVRQRQQLFERYNNVFEAGLFFTRIFFKACSDISDIGIEMLIVNTDGEVYRPRQVLQRLHPYVTGWPSRAKLENNHELYQSKMTSKSIVNSPRQQQLKQDRAWDLAIGPAKSLPMQGFMLYMSGGGVQIFSMGIVFMLLLTPFRNIAGMNSAFAPFAPLDTKDPHSFGTLTLQKLLYIGCNLLTLGVGLWKCSQMGLLPMGTGDWLAFETREQPPEAALF